MPLATNVLWSSGSQVELTALLLLSATEDDMEDKVESDVRVSTSNPTREASILKQQTGVRRIFRQYQIFFFALTYLSSWEAVIGNLVTIIYNGGPSALCWGTLVATIGALAQSASMAEMASMLPVAGAQYHWTAQLARTRHARFLCWLQGWTTWFGWISLICSSANFTAYILQGLVIMNNPSYVPERWHLTLMIWALILTQALLSVYAFRWVPWLEVLAGFLHIGLFVIFVVVLLIMAPKHTAEFVFLQQADGSSGWTNSFVSWNVGLIAPVWGFVGFDGAIHMSEEAKASRESVPRAVFWGIVMNGLLAWLMVIVILFCMGPVDDVLNSSYPIFTVLQNGTGSQRAATALTCGLFLISMSADIGGVASAGRLTWAWARDGGLHPYFSFVDKRHKTPVRAVWLPVVITGLLSLINIGSSAAFGAFISLSAMAMFSSYFIAIAVMLHARSSAEGVQLGEWNLGRLGVPANIFALVYSAYCFVFMPWPSYLPVTAVNMNYSSPLWAFAILFSVGSWWGWGRRTWPGLNRKVIEAILADVGH